MRKSASRGSKIAPDFCISGRFLRLRACPALRAARFRRGSKASGGRDGACGGEKAPLFPGRMPIRGGVPGKTGRREGKRCAALDAVGWLSPGPFLLRVSRRTGRRSRGGLRWGGAGAFAFGRMRLRFGGCPFLLRREESFVGGCGDGGLRERPRALSVRGFWWDFPRWRRSVGSLRDLFCRAFRGGRERRSRGGSRGMRQACSPLGGCACAPGNARFFCGAKSRSLVAAGMAGQGKGRALFLHAAF